ncbi:TPA: glycosyltransferase family 4 protein [Streptococcus suis]
MAKILFISNIAKRVGSFSVASIAAAKACGMEYYYAANWDAASMEQREEDERKYGIKLVHVDLARLPYSPKNLTAYKQLVEFIKREKIDYIHCNTPVGGILGRLVGQTCRVKRIVYQVHGFHFYDGAPRKNWFIYYPIEKWLARKTDAIITINREDFERASSFKLRNNGRVYYVPGVGMDLEQYMLPHDTREIMRKELGLKDSEIALISMGDLIERKNYKVAIEAVAKLNDSSIHYYICGKGPEEENLKSLAEKLGVKAQIHFLGYRTDIKELLRAADIFLFTSKQEGLARSLMEAMASGLPCVASKIRGNTDLIEGTQCGYLCSSVEEYSAAIKKICLTSDRKIYRDACIERIKKFDMKSAIDALQSVYSNEYR